MYENVDRILKTKICVVRMPFLFDLEASGIWPINQPTVRDGNFSYLTDNLLSINMIILHTKKRKKHDLSLNQKQFNGKCIKLIRTAKQFPFSIDEKKYRCVSCSLFSTLICSSVSLLH